MEKKKLTQFVTASRMLSVLMILFMTLVTSAMANELGLLHKNKDPMRVAIGPGGKIYATDATQNAVFIYDTELKLIGELKNLNQPLGVALDTDGNIYIGNNGSDNIGVYSRFGRLVRTIGNGNILMPNDIAIDRNNTLYVVDSLSNNVKVYNARTGALVSTIGGPGDGQGQFKFPVALVISGDNLYVADQGHSKIQAFDLSGNYITSYGELLRDEKTWEGKFKRLQSIKIDALGRIHAVDSYAHRVQILNAADGQYIDSYGSFGFANENVNVPLDILISNKSQVVLADSGKHKVNVLNVLAESFTCSGDADCPALYNCEKGACVIVAESNEPESETTTTVPASVDPTDNTPCVAVKVLGKSDPSLNALRAFRDKAVPGDLVSLYYDHSAEVAAILAKKPKLNAMFRKSALSLIPVIKAGLDKNSPVQITSGQYEDIIAFTKALKVAASPELRTSLSKVLAELKTGKLLTNMNITVIK